MASTTFTSHSRRRSLRHRSGDHGGIVLLALMVVFVVAVVAIMLPQYHYRRVADQIALVVREGAQQQAIVEACIAQGKRSSGAGDGACKGTAAGLAFLEHSGNTQYGRRPTDPTLGVPQLAFQPDGTVTLTSTFGNRAADALTSKKIVFTRDRAGTWTCTSTASKKHHHPSSCPSIAAD